MTYKAIRCSSVVPADHEQRTNDCLSMLWYHGADLDNPSVSLNMAFNNPVQTFKKGSLSPKDDTDLVVCYPQVNRIISPDTYHQNIDCYIFKGMELTESKSR